MKDHLRAHQIELYSPGNFQENVEIYFFNYILSIVELLVVLLVVVLFMVVSTVKKLCPPYIDVL